MAQWIELLQICTAASHRDGLLSMLEGGLTSFEVSSLPATMQFTVVAQLAFTEPDTSTPQRASLEVMDPHDSRLVASTAEFDTTRPSDADLALPYTFTMIHNVVLGVELEGVYSVRLHGAGGVREASFRIRLGAVE